MGNNKTTIERKRKNVRSKIGKDKIRLSIHRSSRYLFAQLIDSKNGKTILGISDKKGVDQKGTKSEKAKLFGENFAKEALKLKIKEVIFDRGSFRYHGRIRAFAQGARDGGLQF